MDMGHDLGRHGLILDGERSKAKKPLEGHCDFGIRTGSLKIENTEVRTEKRTERPMLVRLKSATNRQKNLKSR